MICDFNSIETIKEVGFTGFKSMKQLFTDSSILPETKGVYLILNFDAKPISFLSTGTAGFFKKRNPNVTLELLNDNWITNSLVIYIGKTGGKSKGTLKSRLKQYISFGQGKNVGHWGGRMIWQIATSQNLVVCWKSLPDEDPRTVEVNLIKEFRAQFGKLPFANLIS
jgi:hypothetical protein